MRIGRILKLWEYGSELVATSLIYYELRLIAGNHEICAWFMSHRSDLFTALSVALAGTGLAFAAFFAVLCTDFGKRLRIAGEASAYTQAFAFPPGVTIVTLAWFEFVDKPDEMLRCQIAVWLSIYVAILSVTMYVNTVKLVSFWQAVDQSQPPAE